jgi:transcriptional regulator with XRE-family HTH domain
MPRLPALRAPHGSRGPERYQLADRTGLRSDQLARIEDDGVIARVAYTTALAGALGVGVRLLMLPPEVAVAELANRPRPPQEGEPEGEEES